MYRSNSGIMRFPKEPKLRLGTNLAISRALSSTCFPATMQQILHYSDCPLSSHAAFGVNVQHWRQLLSTGHGRQACLNNNNPCSHPPSSHAAPSLHVFTPFQVNFLPLLVHRPSAHDGRSSPLTPTQPCLQQAGSLGPRVQRRSSIIVHHHPFTHCLPMIPSLD